MNAWRRVAVSAALAVLTVGPGASPIWGWPVASATAQPTAPNGLTAPSNGAPDAGDGVVQSWALSPGGNDTGGNRPNLSYEVPAGSEVKDDIILYNLSNVPMTFRLYATDAFNNKDGGFDLLPGVDKPKDVGNWVTLPQENIQLQPRTQAKMPIVIKVPITATPGDHSGGIVASNQSAGIAPDGKVVQLDRRTGPRLYVRVAGPLRPSLAVENLGVSYSPALNPVGGTADVKYRIQNRGNVRMAGHQQVSVSGPLGLAGKRKAKLEIPELLPGQGVTLEAKFDGVAATALQTAKVRLEPAPVGAQAGRNADSWRSFGLAPPYTVMALAVSVWLLLRARRAYVKRRADARAEPFTG